MGVLGVIARSRVGEAFFRYRNALHNKQSGTTSNLQVGTLLVADRRRCSVSSYAIECAVISCLIADNRHFDWCLCPDEYLAAARGKQLFLVGYGYRMSDYSTFLGVAEGNDDDLVNAHQKGSYPIFTTHWTLKRLFFPSDSASETLSFWTILDERQLSLLGYPRPLVCIAFVCGAARCATKSSALAAGISCLSLRCTPPVFSDSVPRPYCYP